MKRGILIAAILLVFLFTPIRAQAAIPEPTADFYVGDYADVLSDETQNEIIDKNIMLEESTGAQIVVVTVDYADGLGVEQYADRLFNQWKIGSESLNNGLLLILFIGEDDYYAKQGKGLEQILTAGDIDDLLYEELEPYFARQDYDKGVSAAFQAFYDILDEHYGKNPVNTETVNNNWSSESQNSSAQSHSSRTSHGAAVGVANLISTMFTILFIVLLIIFILVMVFVLPTRRSRRRTYYAPPPPRRRWGWSSWGWSSWGHHHRMPPPPPPNSSNNRRPTGGSSSTWGSGFGLGGGGSARSGSGAGRSSSVGRTSSSGRSSAGRSSFGSSRSFGGSRSGGGGSSRSGSGAGRRR